MDIGNAKIAVYIGIQVFREFFDELYTKEILPHSISFDKDSISKTVTVLLDQPSLVVQNNNNDIYPRLELRGQIELRPLGETEGEPEITLPLSVNVRLDFNLKDKTGEAPVLNLAYGGVDGTPGFPVTESDVDDLFNTPEMSGLLDSVEIDVLGPLIEGLSAIFFEEDDAPEPDKWPTQLRICMPSDEQNMEALGIFVALPGEEADPGQIPSWLAANTGFGIIYSRDFLDFVLEKGANEQVGEKVSGAKIKSLSMKMLDEVISVNGEAEKDDADITFDGPISVSLIRGTTHLNFDTRDIDVDVDLPWYADILPWVAGILFFIPILNIADIWLIPLAWDIEKDVAAAPGQVRGGLASSLASGMEQLSKGLKIEAGFDEVTVDSTPDHSNVVNGHMGLYSQVFVSTMVSTISDGEYSKYYRRFVEFTLANGRQFKASELARLVKNGKIETPNFHDVGGKYMRADPDENKGNNLLEMFK